MSLVRKNYLLNNQQFQIYLFIDSDSNCWFKAKEIANILNYRDTKCAIEYNVDYDDKMEWDKLKEKMEEESFHHLDIPYTLYFDILA